MGAKPLTPPPGPPQIFNLSEKRRDLARLKPQAPPPRRCRTLGGRTRSPPPWTSSAASAKHWRGWLRGQPQRLAVLHCKGSKGKAGVIVAAYMHYSQVTASAEQALSTLSMRKFCEEKVAMQPSQRRAVELFGALLSGRQRLSSSPVFLQLVLLPALPRYGAHGCRPFLKIYQALQLVYTSGVYSPGPHSLCISLEPALLLKGDVLVTCYHRQLGGREPVFRAQFHTGMLRGGRLRLPRGELDLAWEDERFPPEGSVEFVFSSGPEKISGWDPPGAPPAPVDYGVLDPAVRRDSYEGFDLRHQDSLEELPLDSSPSPGEQRPQPPWSPGGGSPEPRPPQPGAPPSRPPPPTAAERQELERLLGGFGVRGGAPGRAGDPDPGGWPRASPPPQQLSTEGGGAGGSGDPPGAGAPPTGGSFVQDTTKFWFKPGLSRERAVALLQREAPGSFLIRQSSSFRGAFGLALRGGEPPPRCPPGRGDPQEQLVRHFLIETGPRGVKIKGCPEEPHFGSLPALVLHHSISPISLPCALRIPTKDPLEDAPEGAVPPNMSTAAELLRQGAACRVLYVGSAGTESLTGPPAVAKAAGSILADPARAAPEAVHFKVTAQGITLTDTESAGSSSAGTTPTSSITHCSTDPQDRRWVNPDGTTSKIFGFVARQWGGPGGSNSCHLFAELDPEQPAGAIVTFITKVLLGTRRQ
ncbi:LOW QUALITY PROTEIN: tensin-2-like [Ara ararauna]